MPSITMDIEDFTTLANWAEQYGIANDMYSSIRKLVHKIENANSLTRKFLGVRWLDAAAGPPPGFPIEWPPAQSLQLSRYTSPWTHEEVTAAVAAHTANPVTIEVTRDRTMTVGWFDIDTFFGRS